MTTRLGAVCLLVAAGAVGVTAQSKPPAALIDAVDAAVLRRLTDPSATRFGITRVGERHNPEFKPETPAEEQMVSEMQNAGWSVRFYLGGRGLLMSERRRSAVQGPVAITSSPFRNDAPPAYALQFEARTALQALATRPAADFAVDQWYVAARQVRATTEACVNCHNRSSAAFGFHNVTVKMGDLLGVAMYAFAPAAATPALNTPRAAMPTVLISGLVTGADEAVLARVKFTFARLGGGNSSLADRLIDVRPTFGAGGSFTMQAPEGRFELRVVGMPDGHHVKSLTYGNVDLLEDPMVVARTTSAPLVVTLTPLMLILK